MSEVPATFILDASLPACAYAVVVAVIRMPFVSVQMYPTFTVQPVYSHSQYNSPCCQCCQKSTESILHISEQCCVLAHEPVLVVVKCHRIQTVRKGHVIDHVARGVLIIQKLLNQDTDISLT